MSYKLNKYLVFLIILTLLFGCGSGFGDIAKDFSGGYKYRLDGSSSYILADNIFNEGIYPIVKGYAFNKDFILVLQKPSKKLLKIYLASDIRTRFLVLANIKDTTRLSEEDYNFMRAHLIADSSFYRMLSGVLSPDNTMGDIMKSQEIAEKIIKNSAYYQRILSGKENYWIIDHINQQKYGPFTKKEYLKKAEQLNIPKDLQHEFEDNINY